MWWQDEPTYAKHHLPDIVSPGEVGKALGQYLRMPQVHPCFGFRTWKTPGLQLYAGANEPAPV